jgi:hypothetical protein
LCTSLRSLALCTSDELALELCALRKSWAFFPLLWEEDLSSDLLLPLIVTGLGPRWVRPARQAKQKRSAEAGFLDILATLDQDPRAVAQSSSRVRASDSGPGDDPPPFDESDQEKDLLGDFPAEFVEDVARELAEGLGLGEAANGELLVAMDALRDTAAEDEAESDASLEHRIAAADDERDDLAAASPEEHLVDPVSLAVMCELGHVSCPQEPWAQYPRIGRITTWPQDKPLDKRSVSCKCYYHDNCSSPARGRSRVSDAVLLAWLFAGQCEPMCSRGRSMQLAADHKLMFARIVDSHPSDCPSSRPGSSTDLV